MATKKIAAAILWIALGSVLILVLALRGELLDLLRVDAGFRRILLGGFSSLVTLLLVYKGLEHTGALAKNRPIERLKAMRRDDSDRTAITVPVRLPIRVRRRQPTRPLILAADIIGALLFAMYGFFPPPGANPIPAFAGLFLMIVGIILTILAEPATVCDITVNGITAPAGLLARKTFVPWKDLASCEIVHADENLANDYFVLRDAGGNCRLSAQSWLPSVPVADRAAIYHALRARFPGKIKGDTTRSQALGRHVSSSLLWDEELDG